MRKKDMMKRIKKLEHIIERQNDFIEYQHNIICDIAELMGIEESHNAGNVITDPDLLDFEMLDFPNGHK